MSGDRTHATLVVFCYNQSRFIRDAVSGALAQTYSPLQIIFSDDGSTDDSFLIIERLTGDYSGPHRLTLNRNLENLGIGGHVNSVMALATGEIIVGSAGDDICDPERVAATVEAFRRAGPAAYSVWSSCRYIDEAGRPVQRRFPRPGGSHDDLAIVRNRYRVLGATHAWRRDVFDLFGRLLPDVMFEDNAISFRSHLLGSIAFIDRPLVSYRAHASNITNFVRVADPRRLYAGAARRASWALIGIEQRERDLALALARGLTTSDGALLARELHRQRRMFERRLAAYEAFPTVTSKTILGAVRDPELARVAVRAIASLFSRNGNHPS